MNSAFLISVVLLAGSLMAPLAQTSNPAPMAAPSQSLGSFGDLPVPQPVLSLEFEKQAADSKILSLGA